MVAGNERERGSGSEGVKGASLERIGQRDRKRSKGGLHWVKEDKLRKWRSGRNHTKEVESEQQREHFGEERGCTIQQLLWLVSKRSLGLTTSACIYASKNIKYCHLAASSRGWLTEEPPCLKWVVMMSLELGGWFVSVWVRFASLKILASTMLTSVLLWWRGSFWQLFRITRCTHFLYFFSCVNRSKVSVVDSALSCFYHVFLGGGTKSCLFGVCDCVCCEGAS